jgi:hypothetical protein
MDNSRLRIATRIHYLLARYLGDGIDVGAMLKREDYAREVLFVCDASDDAELQALARQYREAPAIDASLAVRPTGAPAAGRPAPQDTAWAQDTSGFGVSRPPAAAGAAQLSTRRAARWYKPSTWFDALEA